MAAIVWTVLAFVAFYLWITGTRVGWLAGSLFTVGFDFLVFGREQATFMEFAPPLAIALFIAAVPFLVRRQARLAASRKFSVSLARKDVSY